MGAVGVGATIYFGSEESGRQIVEIAKAFDYAHELGVQPQSFGVRFAIQLLKKMV